MSKSLVYHAALFCMIILLVGSALGLVLAIDPLLCGGIMDTNGGGLFVGVMKMVAWGVLAICWLGLILSTLILKDFLNEWKRQVKTSNNSYPGWW